MKPRGFDRLARWYRALEFAAFGRDLERARLVHLDRLAGRRTILVLGEGDGRCLARLVQAAPHARITCIDLSEAMLARAAARLADTPEAARITFLAADVRSAPLPSAGFDAVVTCFFLDCFPAAEASAVMTRIDRCLRPDALWLWADFALPASGWRRGRARAWLAILYAFFHWETGLATRELPPVPEIFARLGWQPLFEFQQQHGLLRSAVWARKPEARPAGALTNP